jgi:hypothetical protein
MAYFAGEFLIKPAFDGQNGAWMIREKPCRAISFLAREKGAHLAFLQTDVLRFSH